MLLHAVAFRGVLASSVFGARDRERHRIWSFGDVVEAEPWFPPAGTLRKCLDTLSLGSPFSHEVGTPRMLQGFSVRHATDDGACCSPPPPTRISFRLTNCEVGLPDTLLLCSMGRLQGIHQHYCCCYFLQSWDGTWGLMHTRQCSRTELYISGPFSLFIFRQKSCQVVQVGFQLTL